MGGNQDRRHPEALISRLTRKRRQHYKFKRTFHGPHTSMVLGFKGTGINATSHGRPVVLDAFQHGVCSTCRLGEKNAEVTAGCGCARHAEQVVSITKRSQGFGTWGMKDAASAPCSTLVHSLKE